MPFVTTTITVDNRTITTTFDAATNSYSLSVPENSAASRLIVIITPNSQAF